jgi:hypothetical protein
VATNVYRYHVANPFKPPADDPEAAKVMARNGCRYRMICKPTHVHTRQVMVCYLGLEGPDVGLYFVASLSDFAMKFIPDVEPPTVPVPPQESLPVTGGAVPEKVAGHVSTSLGA